MGTIQELVKGYGPDFPTLEQLFGIKATDADIAVLEMPIPQLERYVENIAFMRDVTSGKAVGLLRFEVIKRYLFALNYFMNSYNGRFKDKKIVSGLSDQDVHSIAQLCTTPSDILQAQAMEKFTEHDTAAATDLVKLKIGYNLPHLENMVEAVHFANTSEDVMGNVFGIVGNRLFYRHLIPAILDFCDNIMAYAAKCETDEVGDHVPLVIPECTHEQGAEPITLGKKFGNTVTAIDYLIQRMMINGEFIPFSGKLGGAIGDLKTHFAAYPDADWRKFAKNFVENLGLHYEEMTNQSVTYVVEAQHFVTVANMLTIIEKFTDDFIKMARCPGQLFVKTKKKGTKGSSIMPNKSNAWNMEGAIKMFREARELLFFYARELPAYPDAGNMGRSYMFRAIGEVLMPVFIGLNRVTRELKGYKPNPGKIKAFFDEYPGMSGSCIQTVLKRERIEGDAYRMIESIAINPDSTYANAQQFREGLERKMAELNLPPELRQELTGLLVPENLIQPADAMARDAFAGLKINFGWYRQKLAKYAK